MVIRHLCQLLFIYQLPHFICLFTHSLIYLPIYFFTNRCLIYLFCTTIYLHYLRLNSMKIELYTYLDKISFISTLTTGSCTSAHTSILACSISCCNTISNSLKYSILFNPIQSLIDTDSILLKLLTVCLISLSMTN